MVISDFVISLLSIVIMFVVEVLGLVVIVCVVLNENGLMKYFIW